MNKLKGVVLGIGQVGGALMQELSYQEPVGYDIKGAAESTETFDIMHVAFPYSDKFVEQVKAYQEKFKPKFTVIHSTVPVGTSRQCDATHSPIVGIHPHLAKSLKTFTKFLSGAKAYEVADYFRRAGFKIYLFDKQETTELAKLSQTTFYALTIEYVKDLKRQCDSLGLSYPEVYTIPALDYNRGYEDLGMGEIKIPLLVPIMKPQGGHCTIPNCGLWDTEFTRFIKQVNGYHEKSAEQIDFEKNTTNG